MKINLTKFTKKQGPVLATKGGGGHKEEHHDPRPRPRPPRHDPRPRPRPAPRPATRPAGGFGGVD